MHGGASSRRRASASVEYSASAFGQSPAVLAVAQSREVSIEVGEVRGEGGGREGGWRANTGASMRNVASSSVRKSASAPSGWYPAVLAAALSVDVSTAVGVVKGGATSRGGGRVEA